jgi:hypothetical protein
MNPASSPSVSPAIQEFSAIAVIPLLIALLYAIAITKNKETNR